jgi:3-hydroxyisobutyrate dehydrogenase-like beta-hydroxyacid dehydrogenase
MGEIGRALAEVLSGEYEVWAKDAGPAWGLCGPGGCYTTSTGYEAPGEVDVLHICFPYSETFIHDVCAYIEQLKPSYTVIHSTVPVGTSRKCGATHSPVIGRHPHLAESIRTMTKFIGGPQASGVADYFRRCGLNVYLTDKSEATELMKLLCTTWLGVLVEATKETKRLCAKYGIPFELWTIWTKEYNDGYTRLGMPYVQRPSLAPIMAKMGGHCVLPNADLLDSWMTRLVKGQNQGGAA